MKITIIVPIGRFPCLIYSCLGNIRQTAGTDELDIALLLSEDLYPEVKEYLQIAVERFKCRCIIAPIDLNKCNDNRTNMEPVNHLLLLDWVVRHGDIKDWVLIQHGDLFYHPENKGWYDFLEKQLNPNLFALHIENTGNIYRLDGQVIPILDDLCGVFNKKRLVEENLSFNWGTINETLFLSPQTNDAVQAGRFRHHTQGRVGNGHFLDGTKAMSLEASIRFHNEIKCFKWNTHHLCRFFKIAESVNRNHNILIINEEAISYNMLYRYAMLSSMCFDKNIHGKYIVPISRIGHNQRLIDHNAFWTDYIKSFYPDVNCIGYEDNFDIDEVYFNGEKL